MSFPFVNECLSPASLEAAELKESELFLFFGPKNRKDFSFRSTGTRIRLLLRFYPPLSLWAL